VIDGELRIYGRYVTPRTQALRVDQAFFSGTIAICHRKRLHPVVVHRLASHPSEWLWPTLFSNRAVHVRLLRQYASGPAWQRRGIARNPKTPTDLLDQLAGDSDVEVAASVAAHRNTSGEAFAT